MRRTTLHNRFDLTTGSLDFIQDGIEVVRDRLKDRIKEPGILVTADALATDVQAYLSTVFPITFLGSTISVGPGAITAPSIHIAYDADGERIELPAGDTVDFKADTPILTTTGVTGTTPFSTGRLSILTPNIPVSGTEDRFVFIAYLSVVKTEALPPDHENIPPDPYAGATNARQPLLSIDELLGVARAHQRIDGYRIYVALPGEVDVSGPIPILSSLDAANDHNPHTPAANTSFPNFTSALYIGRYIIASTGVITNLEPTGASSDTPRPLLQIRPAETVRVPLESEVRTPDTPDGVDLLTYANEQSVSLLEHVSAIGTGDVSARNPHGMQVADLTAGLIEPELATFQGQGFMDGLLDTRIETGELHPTGVHPSNNPIETDALETVAVSNTAFTFDNALNFATAAGAPAAFSGLFDSRIEFTQMNLSGTEQILYAGGTRLDTVRPRLQDALLLGVPLGGVNPFVPFSAATEPVEGNYVIFASPDPDNPNVALLGKAIEGTDLDDDRFVIAKVYWIPSTTTLQREQFETSAAVVDLRSSGLVGTPQVSTEGQGHAYRGLMSQQVFQNLLKNGGFTNPGGASPPSFDASTWTAFNTTGTITPTVITNATDGTLITDNPGPKTTRATKLVFATAAGHDTALKGVVVKLKPDTVYTLAFEVRILDATNPLALSVHLRDNVGTGVVSDVFKIGLDRSLTTWQRVAVPLITTSGISAMEINSGGFLHIRFQNLTGNAFPGTPDIYITNVVLVEGEWVEGFEDGVRSIEANLVNFVPISRSINTTPPLIGGGNLSADRTLDINVATSSTVGVVKPDDQTIKVDGFGSISTTAKIEFQKGINTGLAATGTLTVLAGIKNVMSISVTTTAPNQRIHATAIISIINDNLVFDVDLAFTLTLDATVFAGVKSELIDETTYSFAVSGGYQIPAAGAHSLVFTIQNVDAGSDSINYRIRTGDHEPAMSVVLV